MNLTGNKINVIVWHMEMNGNVENYMKELWGIMKRCKILRAVGTDDEKRITFMLVVTLISGCGKTFLSRLFRSDHGEFTEILTDFLDAAIRMIRRK